MFDRDALHALVLGSTVKAVGKDTLGAEHPIRKAQAPFFPQFHDGCRGEQLGDRGHAQHVRHLHRIALLGIGPSESPGINQPSVLDNSYRSALYLPLAQEIPDELFQLPGSRKIGVGIRYFLIDGAKVWGLLHILGDVLGRGCGGPREDQDEEKQGKRHPKGFFVAQSPVTIPNKIPYISRCHRVVSFRCEASPTFLPKKRKVRRLFL